MAPALTFLALACLVCGLYAQHVRSSPLVYEDWRIVREEVRQPVTLGSLLGTHLLAGRGVTKASWRVFSSPTASHALNVVLHLVAVWLVWLVGSRFLEPWMAAGVAGIMALHPLTVETVAYAASRAELIAVIGVLGALACVTARSAWWWLAVPLCVGVAYGGKETGLIGLALIPLVLWARGDRLWAELVFWGGVAALVVIAAHAGSTLSGIGEWPSATVSPAAWGLIQVTAIWRLVVLSVVPWWLSVSPEIPTSVWAGLASVILLAGLLESAWRARTVSPLLAFGIAWMALVAAPRLFVRTPLSPFNEHQWYLAMPGVACCLIALIDRACARWRPRSEAWA